MNIFDQIEHLIALQRVTVALQGATLGVLISLFALLVWTDKSH